MTPLAATFALVVSALAGFLRGFTGFGSALAAVPLLSLVLEPIDVVPCVLVLQVVAGLQLLRRVWSEVDWTSVRPLLLGALAGTPLGTLLLSHLPADAMRAAIGLVVLAAVALLRGGAGREAKPGRATRLGVGWFSGVLNGGTAMGGPPVVLFFLATSSSVAVGRASLLVYFFFLSIGSLAVAAAAGLVSQHTLMLSLLMLPGLALGNSLGDRTFRRASPDTYRRVVMIVLSLIALASLARALAPRL